LPSGTLGESGTLGTLGPVAIKFPARREWQNSPAKKVPKSP